MNITFSQYQLSLPTRFLHYLIFSSLLLLAGSCQEDESPQPGSDKTLLSFSFLTENNPDYLQEDLIYTILDNRVNAMFPLGLRRDSLIASFSSTAASVKVASIEQYSDSTRNDFTQPVVYTLIAEDSSTAKYEVRGHTFTGMPVVYVETEGQAPITSKEDYLDGKMTIIANGQGEETISQADIEIRGRGNTTWQMPKKPYRFRFSERTEVLGMPAHKVWVLLANYSDKTLLRNRTAFELSRRFGLAYTPRSQFIDLYMNGNYLGNYQLTEQIEIDENRLNIDELESEDIANDKISGGYLLEIDGRPDEDFKFTSTRGVPFYVKSPEEVAPEQATYIQNYVQATEDALFAENFADAQQGYAQYIDVESFINWYLVNELTKNTDAIFNNSVYMHKPRNGKLMMGPVWDYDIGLGNVNYSPGRFTEGWYIRGASWFKRLFEDPAFEERVKARWQALMPEIEAVINGIDQEAAYLQQSQSLNFSKWNILNIGVWPNPVVTGSYQGEVNYLKDWLNKRVEWMDNELRQ